MGYGTGAASVRGVARAPRLRQRQREPHHSRGDGVVKREGGEREIGGQSPPAMWQFVSDDQPFACMQRDAEIAPPEIPARWPLASPPQDSGGSAHECLQPRVTACNAVVFDSDDTEHDIDPIAAVIRILNETPDLQRAGETDGISLTATTALQERRSQGVERLRRRLRFRRQHEATKGPVEYPHSTSSGEARAVRAEGRNAPHPRPDAPTPK